MTNYSNIWKRGAGVAALLMTLPAMAESNFAVYEGVNQSATVHKVTHGIAGSVKYSNTGGYKWRQMNSTHEQAHSEWADTARQNAGYKWASQDQKSESLSADVQSVANEMQFSWGSTALAEEAGYKWGFRSYADQAGYKWGFRSYADQAGYKWGFRSYADQAGYKWGFRSYADQAGYKWGFRSYADQAGYKWGFR